MNCGKIRNIRSPRPTFQNLNFESMGKCGKDMPSFKLHC